MPNEKNKPTPAPEADNATTTTPAAPEADAPAPERAKKSPPAAKKQKPSVVRLVHYYDTNKRGPIAAMILGVEEGEDGQRCGLQLFQGEEGTAYLPCVKYSEEPAANAWSWPPRE